MCKIAEALDGEAIDALGQYYEVQKFVAARQEFDAEKASTGGDLHEIHCETCHSMGGTIAGRGPILAGQWTPYLRAAIKQASSGEHLVPPIMEKRMNEFSAEEIDALVNFYASQQD
jgi:sulfide dehydrogenase cytochrome subunit